ncbi:MAG: transporter, family, tetracycline resistance protein [Myxococcales bacterium]|jgi:MFS family permease|nr:transporter, family, tetracycline resistance protein [Myxococcales bacterium]
MRKASLGTLFLTVFLDLLGFGLVIPFLPGVARNLGASDFVATLPGAVYSLMQFLFVPIWGRLSDRIGRRPVLLVSIAGSALGMTALGLSNSLFFIFAARIFSGIATANIAVAQAYIADVTPPERRARGMGIIGMAFGLGFIIGPFVGGELGHFVVMGRPGALAAFVAGGLSLINLFLAMATLPESLPQELRGQKLRRATPLDFAQLRSAWALPDVGAAMAINFLVVFWFAGMEQTFRLFTEDKFGMSDVGTGRLFGLVGVVAAIVQGGLIARLTRTYGEVRLVRSGIVCQAFAFALLGLSPQLRGLALTGIYVASGLIALGSGLVTPSLSAYVSQRTARDAQGVTLGSLQSASALARVLGPACGGIFYAAINPSAPYLLGSVGMIVAALLALRLKAVHGHTAITTAA